MVIVINDDRVSDVDAYIPLAQAFAADAAANDKGCLSMEVLTDPGVQGRVVYISRFETKEDFEAHVKGKTFTKHVEKLGKYFLSASDSIYEVTDK
ncbi:putative quinol monooxygenase [Murimonas intestini]|uniref:putative quinol monooxygenase n=1 Tax=Murimonas intestini TaxID=1337051 RepID=UPI00248C8905|nr:antibiotic biosynthesis monooxygenase family protein [Murimonas intestini]